jgi:hypothetical protein
MTGSNSDYRPSIPALYSTNNVPANLFLAFYEMSQLSNILAEDLRKHHKAEKSARRFTSNLVEVLYTLTITNQDNRSEGLRLSAVSPSTSALISSFLQMVFDQSLTMS